MYPQQAFRETRADVLEAFVRAHPLGLLISSGADGPLATPIPFDLAADGDGRHTLRGHPARSNPQADAILSGGAVLTVFQGAEAYVSPCSYPSRLEHGRVVPTWNCVLVEARGRAQLNDNPAWLRDQTQPMTKARKRARAAALLRRRQD